jgi:hypothetical protein
MRTSGMETTTHDELVTALHHSDAYPDAGDAPVVVHETHISWVFLVGSHAYKVKKPITTPFLDYGTLDRRARFCHEEVRLDRRYSPELYLGVVPITVEAGRVVVEGSGEPIEFAVKMRRFPDDALLSGRLQRGTLTTDEVLQLAGTVADFHQHAARSGRRQTWGAPEFVLGQAVENLTHLRTCRLRGDSEATLQRLDRWTHQFFDEHQLLFFQRLNNDFIRECHGDLHLDNVIHWRGRLMPFDGIEFNDHFRWIDVLSDAAFLAMDFAARGRIDLGRSFINAYLEQTGDHASLPLLRWYLVYRALVRAKVASIRAEQQSAGAPSGAQAALEDCQSHVELALRYTLAQQPCLWITHGVSGSGKTSGSELVVQRRGAVRLRSDLERKRHFGLAPSQRPDDRTRNQIYCASANHATYCRLRRLAQHVLQAGYSVIVDATFLEREQRALFRELAEQEGAVFAILEFEADEQTLRQRVADRMARDDDASDADLHVLEHQLATRQPLSEYERSSVAKISDHVAAIHPL